MIFGGIRSLLVIALGAVILIALARVAWRKWKKAYMPKPDGSKMTIFGISIPNWDGIKAFAIGVKNFFTVGLANWYDRLKLFFHNIHDTLFGKKGAFKNMDQTKNTLRKVGMSLIIGWANQKFGGWLVKALVWVLNIAFPGAGSIVYFISELIRMLIVFITTQVMLIWNNKKAAEEEKADNIMTGANVSSKKIIKQMRSKLLAASAPIKPFNG